MQPKSTSKRNTYIMKFLPYNIKKLPDTLLFFSGGAILYPIIELIWRGRTHWSMSVAGGLCASIINLANMKLKNHSLALRCCLGGVIITCVEFVTGCIVNLGLGWKVWDYSGSKFNILGQVCPLFTILWALLSLPVIMLSNTVNRLRSNA